VVVINPILGIVAQNIKQYGVIDVGGDGLLHDAMNKTNIISFSRKNHREIISRNAERTFS
jgi:hypothetical protein